MAREIVERFICDRSGEVEIRPAGTTLNNMNEDGESQPDFYARLVLSDGEVDGCFRMGSRRARPI